MVIYPNFEYFPLIISQIHWFAATNNNAVGWSYSVQSLQDWGQIQQSVVYILPDARGITNTMKIQLSNSAQHCRWRTREI
jgi:hypothetical protein